MYGLPNGTIANDLESEIVTYTGKVVISRKLY